MSYELDAEAQGRLGKYFSTIGQLLNNKKRRESFAIYAMGLLGSAERKSAEPLAAAASGDPSECDAQHQRLLHFLGGSSWDDRAVRREAARYAIEALEAHERVRTWIIDDTGFLKQGKHSVGVQRQYTGSAGKVANCQIGVSLSVATQSAHVPIDFELYLPETWTSDWSRREECKIPHELAFRTKEELACEMIERAIEAKVPGDIVLADSWYGRSGKFRAFLRAHGLDYAVGILPNVKMHLVDKLDRRIGVEKTAKEIAEELGGGLRRVTWRNGTMPGRRGKLSARFGLRRVQLDDASEPEWLLIEQSTEDGALKCSLTTLPRSMSKKQIVRLFKERYRTERVYEEMKGELGLDHFEGRSYVGWHHHVSVALCCYAFVVAERMRHFSPSTRRRSQDCSNPLAA